MATQQTHTAAVHKRTPTAHFILYFDKLGRGSASDTGVCYDLHISVFAFARMQTSFDCTPSHTKQRNRRSSTICLPLQWLAPEEWRNRNSLKHFVLGRFGLLLSCKHYDNLLHSSLWVVRYLGDTRYCYYYFYSLSLSPRVCTPANGCEITTTIQIYIKL